MEKASYFIDGKALFGGYPSATEQAELELFGVRHFVDLTTARDRIATRYTTRYNYMAYPIDDGGVPHDTYTFAVLITRLSDLIRHLVPGEMVYVHCKGGHGRAGIVVSALFAVLYGVSGKHAIKVTTLCHGTRRNMKERWRRIGSPQTYQQKRYVCDITRPLEIVSNNDTRLRMTDTDQFVLILAAQAAVDAVDGAEGYGDTDSEGGTNDKDVGVDQGEGEGEGAGEGAGAKGGRCPEQDRDAPTARGRVQRTVSCRAGHDVYHSSRDRDETEMIRSKTECFVHGAYPPQVNDDDVTMRAEYIALIDDLARDVSRYNRCAHDDHAAADSEKTADIKETSDSDTRHLLEPSIPAWLVSEDSPNYTHDPEAGHPSTRTTNTQACCNTPTPSVPAPVNTVSATVATDTVVATSRIGDGDACGASSSDTLERGGQPGETGLGVPDADRGDAGAVETTAELRHAAMLYIQLANVFREDPDMRETLCSTGLRPIVDVSCPRNWVGRHMMHIRSNYYRGFGT